MLKDNDGASLGERSSELQSLAAKLIVAHRPHLLLAAAFLRMFLDLVL